jgi:uncharacterized protein (TIGR03435 family)
MPDSDDITLLKQYAEGDEAAFNTLVERYVHLVYSTALRQVCNPSHAEEITQAVFIILAHKAKSLSPRTILSGWLYQTARLTAANFMRSEISRQQREQEAYMQSTLTKSDAAAWEQIAPLLEEAMGRLGETDRNAIVLRFFENKTAQEVATTLKMNEVVARKRVSRALEKLRKFFTKRGVSSTTTIIAGAISANSVQAAPVALAKAATAIAVAKGAMASASTLTLVKGALNLMAWAKAKTAIIGTSVLVAAATTTAVAINWELNSEALDKNPPIIILRPTQFSSMTGGASSGNKIVLKNVSLRLLLSMAYDPLDEYRMVLPSGQLNGNFDFMFTQSGSPIDALKSEIKKQFGLVAHQETLQTAVLLVKVTNPNAPGLKIADRRENQQEGNFRNAVFKGATIDSLRSWLEAITQTPVIDQTGLTNYYDITVKWKPSPGQSEADAIRQLLPDQFGLELVPTNMPIKMLVVTKT